MRIASIGLCQKPNEPVVFSDVGEEADYEEYYNAACHVLVFSM